MSSLIQAFAKFRGGVKVPHNKHTSESETIYMPEPSQVVIPMQMHIGAPCKPTVKAKDTVMVGQVIADSDSYVSVPIHSPISGKVKKIQPILLSNGRACEAIIIENDGLDTYDPSIAPVVYYNKDEFLQSVRDSGLVGIGGAGFPLHVKLANDTKKAPIDTVIVNGAECEPYITSDYREIIEFPERIISGVEVVMEQLGIERGIIGVEDNKPKGMEALLAALERRTDKSKKIEVMELPSRYPQGAEKTLIYATTGRRVSAGKLPSHVGCLVMNISTVSLLFNYLETGVPLIYKRVTVDGDCIKEPKNVMVPVGTRISEVLEFCGGFKEEPDKIILGGPMMGVAQYSDDLPITKQTNAIITLDKKAASLPEESPCIRCGRCVSACPLSLMPVQAERFSKTKNADMLKKLNVSACMECGCCAFVCPSGRKLVQYMKQAKAIEREAAK